MLDGMSALLYLIEKGYMLINNIFMCTYIDDRLDLEVRVPDYKARVRCVRILQEPNVCEESMSICTQVMDVII